MKCDWKKERLDPLFPALHISANLSSHFVPCFSLGRNVLLRNGVHGHDDHDNKDHHSTDHSYHDNHNRQDYHDQDARYNNRNGLLATDHIHSGGPCPDASGGFGPGRRREGAAFLQASQHQGGVLQSPGDDGRLLAQDQAGHGVQDAMSTWNNR